MGMPSPGWDALIRETRIATRRRKRRRRRRRMLWLLTGVTAAALVVIGLFIEDLAKVPTAAAPAALSASAQTVSNGGTPAAAHRVSPRRHPAAVTYPQVTDNASGLSYRLLGLPWRQGCPSDLITSMFNWSAGENAVAGQVSKRESLVDWHGVACSGLLSQQFTYARPADLEATAMGLVGALDPAYYARVRHYRAILDSTAMQVSGHQAWMVEFMMKYPAGASQGLTWSTELGAVVVADRGPRQAPGVFYVSVPASLGTLNAIALLFSLRMS